MISKTPEPPYFAVIFTSVLDKVDPEYEEMAELLVTEAKKQGGFLGIESVRNDIGITVSYWKDLESIRIWKENSIHMIAQKKGKENWYSKFATRIAKVERDYFFEAE